MTARKKTSEGFNLISLCGTVVNKIVETIKHTNVTISFRSVTRPVCTCKYLLKVSCAVNYLRIHVVSVYLLQWLVDISHSITQFFITLVSSHQRIFVQP